MKVTATRRKGVVFSALILFSSVARDAVSTPSSDPAPVSKPITAPLRSLSTNPHYFTDGSGKAIYLTGSHTWNNFQDWGTNGAAQTLDFTAYVKMLVGHHHNFTLLWAVELPVFRGLPTTASAPPDFTVMPQPISPTETCGSGHPRCKVNINDSDHSYFGIWNDSPQVNRNYFWINFTNGNQTLFMDPYVVYYPRESRNLCPAPMNGISLAPDSRWENVRATMGYIREYAQRMSLAAMTPQGKLSSTGHALARAGSTHSEFLVYAPSGGTFTVDLSKSTGRVTVEWMNPTTGGKSRGADVSGGATRTFTPSFNGDAVLYLSVQAPSRKR
jgi:hypothetical protein